MDDRQPETGAQTPQPILPQPHPPGSHAYRLLSLRYGTGQRRAQAPQPPSPSAARRDAAPPRLRCGQNQRGAEPRGRPPLPNSTLAAHPPSVSAQAARQMVRRGTPRRHHRHQLRRAGAVGAALGYWGLHLPPRARCRDAGCGLAVAGSTVLRLGVIGAVVRAAARPVAARAISLQHPVGLSAGRALVPVPAVRRCRGHGQVRPLQLCLLRRLWSV